MPRLAARASIAEPPSSSSLAPPCVRPRSGSSSRRTSLPFSRGLGVNPTRGGPPAVDPTRFSFGNVFADRDTDS